MHKIELTKLKQTMVSEKDAAWVKARKWYANNCSRPWHSIEKWYACRNENVPGTKSRRRLYLHRAIMERILLDLGVEDVQAEMQGKVVDHADGDGLNNTRENLWLIDQAKNVPEHVKIHNQPKVKRAWKKSKAKGFRRKKKDLK